MAELPDARRGQSSKDRGAHPSKKRILVIDDDPRYIDLIRLRLENEGYDVALAFDGESGLRRAREPPLPDLVLSDVLLPSIDGFEICHTLKSDPATARIPVILMSAIYLDEADRDRGLRSGASRFLVKPDAMLDKPLRFQELLGQVRFLSGDAPGVAEWESSTVLIVDDDPRSLRLLKLSLKAEGYQVLEAESGPRALEHLEAGTIDLVLTDVRMPGMSGLELLAEIRSRYPPVSVVVMTAYGSEQVAVEAMKIGANDYLTKPINTRELGLRLRENLEKHRLRVDRDRLLHQLKDTSRDLMARVEALGEQNRLLQETGRKIQQAKRAQGGIISTISHELHSPMTVIHGAISTALEGGKAISEEKCRNLLEQARAQSERILRLTHRLLDQQRMELGSTLQEKRLDLAVKVRVACDAVELSAQEAGLDLRFRSEVGEAACSADGQALEQMVIHLVANAVQHAPKGSEVEVVLCEAGKNWRVEVADGGPAVPDSLKDRIFEPFVHRQPLQTESPSPGLGLAVVSSLVYQHGGRVGVRDREGGGAVFFFELPRFEEPAAPGDREVVEAVGLAEGLGDEISFLLERHAIQPNLHREPETFLAGDSHAGAVVLDLQSPAVSEHLYRLLKEVENRGRPRTILLPHLEAATSPPALPEEVSRHFPFVKVLSRRPTASELARWLTS